MFYLTTMSASRIFILATAVFLGSLASCQQSCEKWRDCDFYSTTQADCPMYQKSMDCHIKMMMKCDDTYRSRILSSFSHHLFDKNICPGLPDGSCHFGALNECERMAKFYDGPQKCTILKTKFNDIKKCFEDMKKACNTIRGLRKTNRGMERFLSEHKQCTDTQS